MAEVYNMGLKHVYKQLLVDLLNLPKCANFHVKSLVKGYSQK